MAEPTEPERRQQKALAPRVSGDNSLRDPPVPIPNTEVKSIFIAARELLVAAYENEFLDQG